MLVFHTTSCLLGFRLSKYPEMSSIWIIRRFLTDKCQHSSGTGETSSHLPNQSIFLPLAEETQGFFASRLRQPLVTNIFYTLQSPGSTDSPLTYWATLISSNSWTSLRFPTGPPRTRCSFRSVACSLAVLCGLPLLCSSPFSRR